MDPKLVHKLKSRIDHIRQRRESLLSGIAACDDLREIEDRLRLSAILSCKQQFCQQRINRQRFERKEFSGMEEVSVKIVRIK